MIQNKTGDKMESTIKVNEKNGNKVTLSSILENGFIVYEVSSFVNGKASCKAFFTEWDDLALSKAESLFNSFDFGV